MTVSILRSKLAPFEPGELDDDSAFAASDWTDWARGELASDETLLEDWQRWLRTLFGEYLVDQRGQPVGFADHHVEFWQWLWALERGVRPRPFVGIWSRGGAKCLAGSAEVMVTGRERKAIRDLRAGDQILSFNEQSGAIEHDRVLRHTSSGERDCITVRTRSGRAVTLTSDHRVRTWPGWCRAGELRIGDRLASPRRVPNSVRASQQRPRGSAEVRLLAYMICEGATAGNSTFTNTDPVIINDFLACADRMGFRTAVVREGVQFGLRGATKWLRRMGIDGCRSWEKRVPGWVNGLPRRQIWEFLAACFDTDGWIQVDRGRLGITLCQRPLIDDLRQLLLQVGVLSRVGFKPNAHRGAWALVVDQGCLDRCAANLPLRLKSDKLAAAARVSRYSLIDTYPSDICTGLPKGLNRALRRLGLHVGKTYPVVTRGKIAKAVALHPLPRWRWVERADVFWDEVVAIDDAGPLPTFDVEVERNHSLIADGVVSHNSTSVELGCVSLAVRRVRRYALYVSSTQDRADDHVSSIATMFESSAMARYFHAESRRLLSRYGSSKGWRRNRIRTATFTVDALGLDTDVRGIKLDEDRPDVVILDDIDDSRDTQATVEKKLEIIQHRILPAGSGDVAVIAIQNLVHSRSIFTRLSREPGTEGAADFLARRYISGPVPALREAAIDQVDGHWTITAGEPSWEGQGLEACQNLLDDIGRTAFLSECQHDVRSKPGGIWDHVDYQHCTPEEVPELVDVQCWVDPAGTSTEESDCQAIQIDGRAADLRIYRLWSWEDITSPQLVLRLAIAMGIALGCSTVGVETDYGGDTWESVYREAFAEVRDDLGGERVLPSGAGVSSHWQGDYLRALAMLSERNLAVLPMPRFAFDKAGRGHGSKTERNLRMLADYERANPPVHVTGTHAVLEDALYRFPGAPLDLADAAYWGWHALRNPATGPGFVMPRGAAGGWNRRPGSQVGPPMRGASGRRR